MDKKNFETPNEKPFFITFIKVSNMTTFFDIKKCWEEMVDDIKCNSLSLNLNLAKTIIKSRSKNVDEKILKGIKDIFNGKKFGMKIWRKEGHNEGSYIMV
jgi:uncharacterized Fe-S cluster-containing MiaB family protein